LCDRSGYNTYLKKPFGKVEPQDLLPLDVDRFRINALKKKSPQTVKHAMSLLTHKSPTVTQRYGHLRDEALRKSSNLMGSLVKDAIAAAIDDEIINYFLREYVIVVDQFTSGLL
jgi:hypothetical protein